MTGEITREVLEDMLAGAVLYGSGGGGPKAIGQSVIDSIGKSSRQPVIADVGEMADDDWAVIAAGVGSPDAATGFDCSVVSRAVELLAQEMGVRFSYVMAAEIGAGNTFMPLFVSADLGIKALDVAGSTRAVPEIAMSSFAANDVPVSRISVANHGHQVGVTVEKAIDASGPMRAVVSDPAFGNIAGLAIWPMQGRTAKMTSAQYGPYAMRRTFDMAREVGAAVRQGKLDGDPVAAVCAAMNGPVLARGKLRSIEETTGGGFDRGAVIVDVENGPSITIYNQNENLIAWSSASPTPLAIAPDLISYMLEDGTVFSNVEAPAYKGQEIAVLAAPATEGMLVEPIIAAFRQALSAIGYPGPAPLPREC